jgi:Flp pilus assembly protein TadB
MLEEVIDLAAGAGAALMPLLLLAVPGIILFVVLPAILILALVAPLALIGAVLAVPPLLLRRLRRRRQRARVTRSSTRAASGMVGVRHTARCSNGHA